MNETMSEINALVQQALKLSGSKEVFSGVVLKIDLSGTTVTILSNEREFLAFQLQGEQKLIPGQQVSFRIDQFRAVDLKVA
jgi:predicted RNA-binding protein